ncbi:MAG: regulator [Phycisphaerae bacterium]
MSANLRRWLGVLVVPACAAVAHAGPPPYDQWQTFGRSEGLPSDKVFCVLATDSDVWAGTDDGLARYAAGAWTTYTPADGLAHRAVMALAQDAQSGDVWIATLGGLSRYSAGRFDTFNQLNSGLVNDVVYGVTVRHGEVWAATAAGTSRYEIAPDRWRIYDQTNTPMHEIWCYSAAACGDKIYLGVWGGGLLEYDCARDRWKDYRDPDGEMEIDLFRNDGLVHDVVASVACQEDQRVWIGTYFGLSSYDGRRWLNFSEDDSALASNFINFVTMHGDDVWIATDNGLNATDGRNWWSYRRRPGSDKGDITWSPAGGPEVRFVSETIFPHNYILGISFQGDDIWVATDKGLARGTHSNAAAAVAGALKVSKALDNTERAVK